MSGLVSTQNKLAALKSDEVLRMRLAKIMAKRYFRNTMLEELHPCGHAILLG
jgi:hypothetical protein